MLSGVSARNYGPGPQNVKGGDGDQSNNNGSGTQFNIFGNVKYAQVDEAERLRKEREACLESLRFPNMDARRDDIVDPHRHTCDWLFTTREFQQWQERTNLSTHNGVLWIKGKPGAGKSTLMKHTLRFCEEAFSDHLIVAYFFNARGQNLEKTPEGMLRSIIYQLIESDATLYELFVLIYRKHIMSREEKWRLSQLKDFVLSATKQVAKPVLFLVDALDECNERDVRDYIIPFLERLSIDAIEDGVTRRICLSSRHYPNVSIKKALELIVDGNKEHREDMTVYVKESLRMRNEDIESAIQDKADGIFMWVVIVVSLLNKAYDEGKEEAMKRVLEEVPGDLEEVFNVLLGKELQDKAETIHMLQWVLLSKEPLTPRELFAAVVQTDLPSINTIQRRITTASKGLIEVTGDRDELYVQFIHLSVKDFLQRNNRLQKLDQTLGSDPISASHHRLWDRCRVCIEQVFTGLTSEKSTNELLDDNPFLRYALLYIFDHAEKALSAGTKPEAISQWLHRRGDWFACWKVLLYRMSAENPFFESESRFKLEFNMGAGLLYILSFSGFRDLVRALLDEDDVDVGFRGGMYCTAFQAAASKGELEIIKTLLKRGAEINDQGGQGGVYGHALQAAAANGQVMTVEMLLEEGANVNAQGGMYFNALQAASQGGYEEIVRMLLRRGAKINAQGGVFGHALQVAAARGGTMTAEILLQEGANVNARGGYLGSALQAAVWSTNVELVEILLKEGANVNARGGIFSNALQAAASGGEMELVEILLKAGADVNARGGMFGNALQAAASGGEMELVEILLKAGADINAQGGIFGTALQAAASEGEMEVVEILLKEGAEINIPSEVSGKALQASAFSRLLEITTRLLKHGAIMRTRSLSFDNPLQTTGPVRGEKEGDENDDDNKINRELLGLGMDQAGLYVNAQGRLSKNELVSAAYKGDLKRVRMLLDEGADINARAGYNGTALQVAAKRRERNIDMVRLLLERGADVNARAGVFGSALQVASAAGAKDIVNALLKAGADVNARGGLVGNALKAALNNREDGDKDIVMMLLDAGADPNTRSGVLGSALQAAIFFGDVEMVSLLLEKGAKFQQSPISTCLRIPTLRVWLAIFLLTLCVVALWFSEAIQDCLPAWIGERP